MWRPFSGPKGELYIPITAITTNGPAPNNYTGGYRTYAVPNNINHAVIVNHTLGFEAVVPPNLAPGPLVSPSYSVFGRSDPGTLEYLCLV